MTPTTTGFPAIHPAAAIESSGEAVSRSESTTSPNRTGISERPLRVRSGFEPFRYKTTDELGRPRTEKITVEYPLIATVGTAYSGFERFIFAADARFFDYSNAAGFQGTGLDANGALTGLGWSSIFAANAGVQFEVCEPFVLRCGYSYNQNPISDSDIGFNIASPVITQHYSFVGASLRVSNIRPSRPRTSTASRRTHPGPFNHSTAPCPVPGFLPPYRSTRQRSESPCSTELQVQILFIPLIPSPFSSRQPVISEYARSTISQV